MIGKNNSGKSNILSAINAFFSCIDEGSFVNLNPPIGREIDFYKTSNPRDVRKLPIEVTIYFVLTVYEIDQLKQNIIKETPQMKTAVEGIDISILSATININPSSSPFSFVSELALIKSKENVTLDKKNILLSINYNASIELRDNLSRSRQLDEDIKSIENLTKRIEPGDWRRLSEDQNYFKYYTRDLVSGSSEKIRDEIYSIVRSSKTYEEFSKSLENISSFLGEEFTAIQKEELRNKITSFAGEEASIPKYISNLLLSISRTKVLNLTERRKPIGEDEAARLLDLKVRRGGSIVLRNIQETVLTLLGVSIDAFQGSVSSRRSEVPAELDVGDFLVQANGSGIREALRIILDVEFLHPDVLLVEEPEVHLHPSLETSMMQYLKRKSESCQIFITTHSTNFLDTAEMKNIYLVSKTTATSVELLNLEEAEAKIPNELGIRLSSLFMYDKLVFVEGPSDENVLRELASKLEFNLGQYNVGFIRMSGVRNFAYYAAEDTLSFLTKRRVGICFLLDRDEREDDYFDKMRKMLNGRAILKVLSKRELENYLIHPRVLREFIKLKQDTSGKSEELPNEDKIKEDIIESANQLKQFAINKRIFLRIFSPIHPTKDFDFENMDEPMMKDRVSADIQRMIKILEEKDKRIDEIYDAQKNFVNSNWETMRLSIVPGDILIDNVCRKYGTRFNKVKDGERLAALMAEGEIDNEIKIFLEEVCKS